MDPTRPLIPHGIVLSLLTCCHQDRFCEFEVQKFHSSVKHVRVVGAALVRRHLKSSGGSVCESVGSFKNARKSWYLLIKSLKTVV